MKANLKVLSLAALASLLGVGAVTASSVGIKNALNKAGSSIIKSDTYSSIDVDTLDELYFAYGANSELGGAANLLEISSCIKRLRLKVRDSSAIDEVELKKLGARGVIAKGQAVQVIIGTEAEHVADEMKRYVKQ